MGQTLVELRQLQKITTEALLDVLMSDNVIPAQKLKAGVTDAQLGFLVGLTGSIQAQLNAKLESSTLKKNGDVDWSSDLQIATAKAITAKIIAEIAAAGISGTMVFKGNWSTAPATSKMGYVYVYDSGAAPSGIELETGDSLIANVENAVKTTAAHWTVVQANISGAVTSVESAVLDGQLVVFSGTGGKSVKKSNLTGLLKAVSGVLSPATASDLPTHNHSIGFKSVNDGSRMDINTGTDIQVSGTGIVKIKFENGVMIVDAPEPTSVSSPNGPAVAGQYVAGINISGNQITLLRSALPTIPVDVKVHYKTNIVPAGLKNDSNKTFTLPESIVQGTLNLFCNGVLLTPSADYTINGTTITLSADMFAPSATTVLLATYIKA